MKKLINHLLIAVVVTGLNPSFIIAQTAPEIQWQNTIGGDESDFFRCSVHTTDGGYILGGYTRSGIVEDKTEPNLGGSDYWVVKVDGSGNIEWQNTIGGSSPDNFYSLIQTLDGGYLLGGESFSGISGDKTEASKGGSDYWVVKLDGSGNIEWQNTMGGSNNDILYTLAQASDGGYVLGGFSNSGNSGDKTENNKGEFDYWVIKLNDLGNIVWQNTIGSDDDDNLRSVIQTSDGSYLLGGDSFSGTSDDKSEPNFGLRDWWVVKLDSGGEILWETSMGTSSPDNLNSVIETSDGDYMLAGLSLSEPNDGSLDYWMVKLDASGNILWDRTIGGSGDDEAFSVIQTDDGGFLLGGDSESGISGDKTEASQGQDDYWVVKTDASGNIQWQNTIGGSGHDNLRSVSQASDGGYFLGGYSLSGVSGDKEEAILGGYDYRAVKLLPAECNGLVVFADADGDSYGDEADPLFVEDCIAPDGYVYNSLDCDDALSFVYPGAPEICGNAIDDDCNELVDDGCVACEKPSSLQTLDVTVSSAKVTWNEVAGAEGYKLRYKIANTSAWTIKSSLGDHKTLQGLLSATQYVWQVKTICSTNPIVSSDWSVKEFFTTDELKLALNQEIEFEIFPNPFSSSATISFSLESNSHVKVDLFDLAGRKIAILLNENLSPGNHQLQLNRDQLPPGIYFLQLKMNNEIQVQKVIIE